MFAKAILATVRGHCSAQAGESRRITQKMQKRSVFHWVCGKKDDLLALLEDDETLSSLLVTERDVGICRQ